LEWLVLFTHKESPERIRTAEILIQNGANVNATIVGIGERKKSILAYLATKGHVELIKLLLKHGARVNEYYDDGYWHSNPIIGSEARDAAFIAGHTELVKLLEEHGDWEFIEYLKARE
jgi:ankyrin repeat protein